MIKIPNVLLPNENINLEKYAVIACDQFTSQDEYWDELKQFIGDEKSALNIICPEIYLSEDNSKKIQEINSNMKKYIESNTYKEEKMLVLVERTLSNGTKRLGLVISIDLDEYSYEELSSAAIRATELTVVERLPIRIEIRKNAPIETPHIMLLMDDRKEQIINELYKQKDRLHKIYDFKLNMNGGSIKGYRVDNPEEIIEKIKKLKTHDNEMLFAVGDGNHSLATAKECWNIKKSNGATDDDPAKYALCELVSLYDESLEFEPIHRILINADEHFINSIQNELKGENKTEIIFNEKSYFINTRSATDSIKDIQDFIDEYMTKNKNIKIDYIHNDDYLKNLTRKYKCVGILMPTIKKTELFDYVERRGVLPRKAFSMGIAEDKRYYLEARKIIK